MKKDRTNEADTLTNNNIMVAEYWLRSHREGVLIAVSEGVEAIFGVSIDEAKSDVDLIWDLFLKEDLDRLKHQIQSNSKSLQPFQGEYQLTNKLGVNKCIQASCTPKKENEDGCLWNLFFSDITSQKAKQSNLIKSSFELNRLMQSSKDIICISNGRGYFTKVNPAAAEILGYSTEELLSRPYIDFVLPEDVEQTVKNAKKETLNKSTGGFQNRYLTKSGKIVWLSWTSTFDYETSLYYAVAIDISEQKSLQLMLDNTARIAQIGGWEYTIIDDKVKWTNITNEIFEVDSDENLTLNEVMNFCRSKRHKDLHESALRKGINEGKEWDIELEMKTAQGNIKWIRSIGKALTSNGSCVKLYGSVQDITAKKIADQSLQQAYEENKVILDSISDAFISLDKEWRVTYWNNTAKKISNLNDYQVLGKNIWDFYPNSSWKAPILRSKELQKTVSFESYSEQWKVWCEINAYPSNQGVSVYIRDISLRRKTEAKTKIIT